MAQSVRDFHLHQRGVAGGSFAQHGEDTHLMQLLERLGARGPYVDIGSNHPFKLSNTYLLYRSGWVGVCIDPLARFKKLYMKWRPRDHFFCNAVGTQPGTVDFHQFEWDPLSTLDAPLAARYIEQGFRRLQVMPVAIRTVDEILVQAGVMAPLSLLSIDIEGHEVDALESMDLDRWQPVVICIEAQTADGGRNEAALRYLRSHGYDVHDDLGLNVIFVRAGRTIQ